MSLGPGELVVIVLVIVLLFGAGRLAALGKGVGDGIREFKRGISGQNDQGAKLDADTKPTNVAATTAPSAAIRASETTPHEGPPDPTESGSRSSAG